MAWYEYEALAGPRQIRLLVLDPGRGDEELSCHLHPASLSDRPKYEALSYAWGDPAIRQTVRCGDKAARITTNLFNALRHLRDPTQRRSLWADALCINQEDIQERSRQVQLMGTIYSTAKRTIIWLGEEAEEVKGSLEILQRALLMRPERRSTYHGIWDTFLLRQCAPLYSLLSRPWFQRKWVVQEVAKSMEVLVLCGHTEIPWESLANFAKLMREEQLHEIIFRDDNKGATVYQEDDNGSCPIAITNIVAMEDLRSGKNRALLDIIDATNWFLCTDPHDYLYSVLGLADDFMPESNVLRIDYSLTIPDMLKSLSRWFIVEKRSIAFLNLVSGPAFFRYFPDVPRWALDITTKTFPQMPIHAPFHASGQSLPRARISENGNIFHLTGKVVDKVNGLGSIMYMHEEDPLALPLWIQQFIEGGFAPENDILIEARDILIRARDHLRTHRFLDQFRRMASQASGVISPQRYEEVLRTMSCDMMGNMERASAEFLAIAARYMQALDELAGEVFNHSRPAMDVARFISTFEMGRVDADRSVIKKAWAHFSHNGRFCLTEQGRLGSTQTDTQRGDIICIFYGGNVPFVVRPRGGNQYIFLGPCYIHGIMDGEAMNMGIEDQEFALLASKEESLLAQY